MTRLSGKVGATGLCCRNALRMTGRAPVPKSAGLHTTLYLVAAPKAQTYYPHIGMVQHESCWFIPSRT